MTTIQSFVRAILFVALFTLTAQAASTSGSQFVFVSVGGEKRIAIYELNSETGELTSKGSVKVDGAVGSLAISPSKQYLYASLRSTRSVASFRLDAKTGSLKHIANTPVVNNATYITTDKTGKYLLSAYYGAGKAAIHPITNGKVGAEPTQVLTTGKNPHSILLDPDNMFGYVPCTGADEILQYRWSADKGTLTPLDTPKVTTKKGAGPRHFRFDPRSDSNLVYVVNEKNSSVTTYRQNRKTGQLTAQQRIPTLPDDFDKGNTCADIELTPDGKYVYASNRGHDSLACYSIAPKTGKLTALGQVPTESIPREFSLDVTGRFVFSAGQRSGKMISYRVDPKTGLLRPLKTYNVGKSPSWVLIVS